MRRPPPRSPSSIARVWFAAHGITRVERIVTDNGACYRAESFSRALLGARHQRIAPYTPRHNGKVERYNRILAEEFLYARTWTSEARRTQLLSRWNVHYNYHRPHTAVGSQPPAARLPGSVTNVMASYKKRELVRRLHSEGFFETRSSAQLIADQLGVSRATVYNYTKQPHR